MMEKESPRKTVFIHVPTEDEKNHLTKKESFLKVRDRLYDLLLNPNHQSITFTSSTDNVSAIIPRATVESLINKVTCSIEKDDTAFGFNDPSWREDFYNLKEGSIEKAPEFQEEWRCKDGHTMQVHKGKGYIYYKCPIDGSFKWRETKGLDSSV